MSFIRRLRPVPILLALAALVGAIFLIVKITSNDNPYAPPEGVIDAPVEFTTALWDETLGGDEEITPEDWARLNDPANSTLNLEDAGKVKSLAEAVLRADLTGENKEAWSDYWVGPTADAQCSSVSYKGTSAMELPVPTPGKYAKTILAYTCGEEETPEVDYIYAYKENNTLWVPVRSWQIPTNVTPSAEGSNLPDYELKTLSTCGAETNAEVNARIIVANAWDLMCQDASKDGLSLKADAGYRTREEQADLYSRALKFYGSESEAKRWVSYADDLTCESKHCDGAALSVSDPKSLSWLSTVVGCNVNGEITLATSCEDPSQNIKRSQQYGFVAPVPYLSHYYEFTLPLNSEKVANCSPTSANTPSMVAQIFRCRLQTAGFDEASVEKVVAEALVVSRCESAWNPAAYAFGGKFKDAPHPVSEKLYDQAGVFMLSKTIADKTILEGYPQVLNPVSNINGAASLWLTTGDWSAWGCATGQGELFEAGPLLPQYGGPDLPAWSKSY